MNAPRPMSRILSYSRLRQLALILLASAPLPSTAFAQMRGCTVTAYTDPPRSEFSCPDGLRIAVESGAAYRLFDRNRDGRPDGAELPGLAWLIVVRRRRPGGFQILPPHAVASVRGTVWVVDVEEDRSSVFVRSGAVGVARRGTPAAEVTLKDGDGVDVEAESGPLKITKWGLERRAGLLARVGR